jgi:hypothetical protein
MKDESYYWRIIMRGLSVFMLAIIFVFFLAVLSYKEEVKKGQNDFQTYSKSVNLLEGIDDNKR